MKKVILTLFLIWLSKTGNAQMVDSTIIKRLDNIELNLKRSHDAYRGGTILVLTGMLITGLSFAMDDAEMSGSVAFVGGGMMTIGGILHIDSHKYLGRIRKNAKKIK